MKLFLTENKYENRIRELANYRYRDGVSIKEFIIQEDAGEIGAYPPAQYD